MNESDRALAKVQETMSTAGRILSILSSANYVPGDNSYKMSVRAISDLYSGLMGTEADLMNGAEVDLVVRMMEVETAVGDLMQAAKTMKGDGFADYDDMLNTLDIQLRTLIPVKG